MKYTTSYNGISGKNVPGTMGTVALRQKYIWRVCKAARPLRLSKVNKGET